MAIAKKFVRRVLSANAPSSWSYVSEFLPHFCHIAAAHAKSFRRDETRNQAADLEISFRIKLSHRGYLF